MSVLQDSAAISRCLRDRMGASAREPMTRDLHAFIAESQQKAAEPLWFYLRALGRALDWARSRSFL